MGHEGLPWVWGVPPVDVGAVWYLAPGAKPLEGPRPPPLVGHEALPWVWGVPPLELGAVWYLARGAPIYSDVVERSDLKVGLSKVKPPKPPEPAAPPPSRTVVIKRRLIYAGAAGLTACGIGMLGVYASATGIYNGDDEASWNTLLIPVVGPYIASIAGAGLDKSGNEAQRPFLIAAGTVASVFTALLITGLRMPNDPKKPAHEPTLPVVVTPQVSQDGGGIGITGSF